MVINRKTITVVFIVVIAVIAIFITTSIKRKSSTENEESPRLTSEDVMAKPVSNEPSVNTANNPAAGKGLAAIDKAAEADKYLFVFFYRTEDQNTMKMKGVFDAAARKVTDKVDSVTVNITDPSERGIVNKFRLDRAPMPLAMIVAPNGAVTGAFPNNFQEQQFMEAIVSPCTEKCIKALQERKLVFLCVQNNKTKKNDAAMRGVTDFKADERFKQATEIITVDPSIDAEMKFLGKLKIKHETDEALTVFLAPPGRIIGTYNGATDKATLEKMLLAVMSSCASGCGPSGCGPKK